MTHPPKPDEAADVEITEAELIAIDRQLDNLAGRRPTVSADPALAALAEFARAVDARAAAVSPDLRPALPPTPRTSEIGRAEPPGNRAHPLEKPRPAHHREGPADQHPPTRSADRSHLWRTLKGIPVVVSALALALLAAVPLNSSPDSPLYPLHQLIFEAPRPSPADRVRVFLASARQDLDEASHSQGSGRTARLDSARQHLAEARKLVSLVTDPHARSPLDAELSNLEQRVSTMAGSGDQQTGDLSTAEPGLGPSTSTGTGSGPGSGPGPQDGAGGTHATETATSGSDSDSNISAGQGLAERRAVGSS